MLTIRQYNKIIHDWIVLLTGLSGSNVRPQKDKFGFNLVDTKGKPIAFDSLICMFYFNFEGPAQDMFFSGIDTSSTLKTGALTVTFVGEQADEYVNLLQATSLGNTSRNYLAKNGFAIQGRPNEIDTTRELAEKWFYRRTLKVQFNVAMDFVPPNLPLANNTRSVALFTKGVEEIVHQPLAQTITVYPGSEDKTVTADDGHYLEKVIVKAINLQEKVVTPTLALQIVEADEGYSGLSKVTVNAAPVQAKTASPSAVEQTILPDDGYLGMNEVIIAAAPLENITVASTYEQQVITPTTGNYGIGQVTVQPKDADQEYLDFIQGYDLMQYLNAPMSYIGQSIISNNTQTLQLDAVARSYDPTEYTSTLLAQVQAIYLNILGDY